MIVLKTKEEIVKMREGGRLLAQALDELKKEVKPGVTTEHLDKIAEKLILKTGGKPSFKMVAGYHWTTCLCVNEVVVHGIPDGYKLKEGDLLGIDIGNFFQGFHTDMAETVMVGAPRASLINFLDVGKEALKKAIAQAKPGNRVGHISKAIDETVSRAGFSPVRALVGHGVGRNLHEEPPIPCFLKGKIEATPLLKAGMTLAIEIIYNQGKYEVVYKNNDGWTIQTIDNSLSGLFEETIAILQSGPEVLTKRA